MTPPATEAAPVRLTDLIGVPVRDEAGRSVGRVADLVVELDAAHPAVRAVLVRRGRGRTARAPWDRVAQAGRDGVTLRAAPDADRGAEEGELLLGRDVLDVQVVDLARRRMARVGDVDLVPDGGLLRVAAVDVGWRAILRRLGLRRLARGRARDAIDWSALHLASGTGHALQLSAPDALAARLDADDLAALLALLPPHRGAQILAAQDEPRAAAAVAAVHPELGADLVEELPLERAQRVLTAMDEDEAAAALRQTRHERRHELLERIGGARAARIRSALAGPPAPEPGAPRPPRRYWRIHRGHQGWR